MNPSNTRAEDGAAAIPINTRAEDDAAARQSGRQDNPVLRVERLTHRFHVSGRYTVNAVQGVSFEILPGETYGLVGESGSGKSTIGRALIRLYTPSAGRVVFKGVDVSGRLDRERRALLRSGMQMIFQDPMACLNPRKKVFDIVAHGLALNHLCPDRRELARRVYGMLDRVGLPAGAAERYPHQFSGGQRQRIGIARALVMNPALIIADEPISALDVSIQAQIVNLMREIQEETGVAYLFIAHDLTMVRHISDRIGVLHKGYLVESGSTDEIFTRPVHPYTRSLLQAIPRPNPLLERRRWIAPYDWRKEGIDYSAGERRHAGGTHHVLATEAQCASWLRAAG